MGGGVVEGSAVVVIGGVAYYLREIEGVIANSVEDQVLQLIDSPQQVVAERSHGSGCGQAMASGASDEERSMRR